MDLNIFHYDNVIVVIKNTASLKGSLSKAHQLLYNWLSGCHMMCHEKWLFKFRIRVNLVQSVVSLKRNTEIHSTTRCCLNSLHINIETTQSWRLFKIIYFITYLIDVDVISCLRSEKKLSHINMCAFISCNL